MAANDPGSPEQMNAVNLWVNDLHSYLRANVDLADRKTSILFAVIAGVLAYLHSSNATHFWLVEPRYWHVFQFLAFVAVAALLIGGACSLLTVLPRTRGSKEGLVFWNAIARNPTAKDYADNVLNKPTIDLLRAKLENCHELAHICERKFFYANAAVRSSAVGLIAALLYFAFPHEPPKGAHPATPSAGASAPAPPANALATEVKGNPRSGVR